MEYTIKQNDVIAKAFKNAPLNNQTMSPKIQKDIIECFAREMMGTERYVGPTYRPVRSWG